MKPPYRQAFLIFLVLAAPAVRADAILADAAEARDIGRVKQLIEAKAPLDAAQDDGMTALHWACYHDQTAIVRSLLEAGASATAETRYGITPLAIACSNGNGSAVQALLRKGANPNTRFPGQETALMTAARVGRMEAVKALVEAGAEIDATIPNGQNALMWAANEGHVDVVRYLIERGGDHLAALPSGFNPYFFAARQGHTALVRYFLDSGLDINTAMAVKTRGGRVPQDGSTALILAIENGHFDLAVELLERGADANDARTGLTPLHTLARVRKPDRGEGPKGDPPPAPSGDIDSLELVRILVAHGADVNARLTVGGRARQAYASHIGATPFFLASDTADLPYMKLLVELGADPFVPNEDQVTPLMMAAGVGSQAPEEEAGTPDECLEAVRYLVSLGADINAVSDHGDTAMHGAAFKNAPQVAAFLNAQGADIRIWNNGNRDGRLPLFIAEGYRPGNFKPDFATVDVISAIMKERGAVIPTERPVHVNYAP